MDVFEEQRTSDRDTLPDPGDWFGSSDVQDFLYETDSEYDGITEAVKKHWVSIDLPVKPAKQRFDVAGIRCPDDVRRRAEEILTSKG